MSRIIDSVDIKHTQSGIWYAVAAYLAWGFLPLYWKALNQVPARDILAHRIVWSFVFVSVVLFFNGRWQLIKPVVSSRANKIGLFLGALLISANWYTYIWAVNNNRVVEASLGYYINPLLTVALGIVVLKERLDVWQGVAFFLAAAGVAVLTIQYGRLPWIALFLAFSFALYGLVKRLVNLDSIISLALETVFVAPAAFFYLTLEQINGIGAFHTSSAVVVLLLICTGVVTAVPLLWFAEGAKRVPFTTLGFIQYLSPSISLVLGVFLFKEPFTGVDLASFAFIWCALAVYSFSRAKMHAAKGVKVHQK